MNKLAAALGAAALLSLAVPATAAPHYRYTVLAIPPGAHVAITALGPSGAVTGNIQSKNSPSDSELLVIADGHLLHKAFLHSTYTVGYGINATGDVVGTAKTPTDTISSAFLRTADGRAQLLFPDAGYFTSFANGINASRTVIGSYYATPSGPGGIFSWKDGVMTPLPPGDFPAESRPEAINDDGLIVGAIGTATPGMPHAAKWQDGVLTDLGGDGSLALAVSSNGLIAGVSEHRSNRTWHHATEWLDGRMVDLGVLDATEGESWAHGVNAAGDVVGYSASYLTGGRRAHAVLWHAGAIYDLDTLVTMPEGWVLTTASGINDAGQILAAGVNRHGDIASVLLTPDAL